MKGKKAGVGRGKGKGVVPAHFGILLAQLFADGVVLAREEGVQHLHASPPVVVEARQDVSVGVAREEGLVPALVEGQLPVGVLAAQALGDGFAGAVDLRAVPPCGVFVAVPGAFHVAWVEDVVGLSAMQVHLAVRPGMAFRRDRDLQLLFTLGGVSSAGANRGGGLTCWWLNQS